MATDERLLKQVADLSQELADFKRREVRWVEAEVTAVDTVNAKITVVMPDAEGGEEVGGIIWPGKFLPQIGDTVRLIIAGAQPLYNANSIATNAITGQELSPAAVGATHLEPLIVLATAFVAGDTNEDYTQLDNTGAHAYAVDNENIPIEVGWFGRGFGFRDPVTSEVVASVDDTGLAAFRELTVEGDPEFQGVPLSSSLWNIAYGTQVYGQFLGGGITTATTNTELAFMDLSFTAKRGRQYLIMLEGIEPKLATTAGAWQLRIRYTSNTTGGTPATPTTASTLLKTLHTDKLVDNSWGWQVPQYVLLNGPAIDAANDTNYRLLFTYGPGSTGAGACIWRPTGQNCYIWVMDIGPINPETGDPLDNVTSGGAATKTTFTYEATADWVRTWNQSGTIIQDDELHQGYADSFNGIRKSAAGWTSIPSMTGATISEFKIYMESYHWWNFSGGTLYMGKHATSAEPASWPTATDIVTRTYTARSQAKWTDVFGNANWLAALQANTFKGIALTAPSTAAQYYGKFRGPAYARPRLRIVYTK